ncbi:hypothetical protein GCM10010911_08130 [Paenibacillus nasutitermitis]|uniref:Major facilitator superfamily (MFS) profile domain-containing protein n=1 Tax=Paenibacillus nasutitermitis TaxID=1652958 RepID=A0A916YNU7_9BACL|nr:MFS transporter [Paenibacillus nasutitermitis]GGD52926.1 hypothetical protein GCM10010911_08130 [Paenibacillus nasutitermitis]
MMEHTSGNSGYWSAAFLKICCCNMLVFFSFQMMLPILPVYLTDTGAERSSAGLVVAIITIAAVMIRLLTGYALDHWNRRRIVLAGSLALLLAMLAFVLLPSIGWIIGCSIGLGIGWGILTATYATIVSDLIPPGKLGAGIGTFMLFGLVSMAVGPYAGGWVYGQFGASALFGTASAPRSLFDRWPEDYSTQEVRHMFLFQESCLASSLYICSRRQQVSDYLLRPPSFMACRSAQFSPICWHGPSKGRSPKGAGQLTAHS